MHSQQQQQQEQELALQMAAVTMKQMQACGRACGTLKPSTGQT